MIEAVFKFKVKERTYVSEMLSGLTSNEDFCRYLQHSQGKELSVHFSPAVKQSEKEQLYAYYHKVVLSVAVQVLTEDGWIVDKVKADYMLKAECAKSELYNPKTGELIVYLEDKREMSKDRLYKYVTDCINWLETERGVSVPDSTSFKNRNKTGFKSVK